MPVPIKNVINLFTFAIAMIGASLSLLWLPDFLLLRWQTALILNLGLVLAALILPIAGRIWQITQHKRNQWLGYIYRGIVWITCCGFIHSSAITLLEQAENIANLPTKISAQIQIEEILHQGSYQTLVASTQLQPNLPNQRIFINWKAESSPKLGELWQAELQLRPLSARLNFAGFDRQQWFFAKQITAQANVKSANLISHSQNSAIFSRTFHLYHALQQTADLPYQGLLIALGFGERAWLSSEVWKIYQQTNTAHLIAISGLHIGLAMAIGFWLARAVQFLLPTRWISPFFPYVLGICLALFYAYLAGFSIPTFRAIVALLWVLLIRWQRRYYSSFQLIILVIGGLLLYAPLMILSSSFWLSVGAVGCLMIWYQYVPLSLLQWQHQSLSQAFPTLWGKVLYWGIGLFHLQCGLLLLFTPIQLFLFSGIGANGFIANLLAVPLYSFFLVPVVLFAVLSYGHFSSWHFANFLAEKITQLIAFFNHHWLTVSINKTLLITALCAMIWMGLLISLYAPHVYKFRQNRKTVSYQPLQRKKYFHLNAERQLSPNLFISGMLVCGGIFLFCVFYWLIRLNQQQQSWQLNMLDVGQGLSVLIVKNQRGILYDTGPSWQGGSMAELEILPYLQREGIRLDKLIISHDDNDHSGGANLILQHEPNVELITASQKSYGTDKNERKIHRSFCKQGEKWQWQGLHFEVLSPPQIVSRAKNEDSCVLLIEDEWQHRVLLTGDADSQRESQFLPQLKPKGTLDVLQVGHHGSKTSTSDLLLAQTKPHIALISASRWNPWYFPHHSVLERLQRYKSAVKNTALSGQIQVKFYPITTQTEEREKSMEINTARGEFSPWYAGIIGLSPNKR